MGIRRKRNFEEKQYYCSPMEIAKFVPFISMQNYVEPITGPETSINRYLSFLLNMISTSFVSFSKTGMR